MKPSALTEISKELSILSRAVVFQNLSSASQNIGISQPQLSRIIRKLERHLGILLLHREVKRRSAWTPIALELAQTFSRGTRSLEAEVQRLIEDSPVKHLRMGSLEGVLSRAAEIGHTLITQVPLHSLELNIYDLQELEDRFLRGELDLILTMREPGRKKYTFSKVLGYQSLQDQKKIQGGLNLRIQSGFEFQSKPEKKKKSSRDESSVLISNSLALRKYWLESFGGSGLFPSTIQAQSSEVRSEIPVLLLGSEALSPEIWNILLSG